MIIYSSLVIINSSRFDWMKSIPGGFNGVTTIYNVECFDDRTEEW